MTLLSFQIFPDQSCDLTRLGVTVQFELGENQLLVDRKLEAPAIRWHQRDRFDIRLKLGEQFGYQTGSPVGVVSDRTVDQVELQCHDNPPTASFQLTPPPVATGVNKAISYRN